MRIGFVFGSAGESGEARIALGHAGVLLSFGHEVTFFARAGSPSGVFGEKAVSYNPKRNFSNSLGVVMGNDLDFAVGVGDGIEDLAATPFWNKACLCYDIAPFVLRGRERISNAYSAYDKFIIGSKELGNTIREELGEKELEEIRPWVDLGKLGAQQKKNDLIGKRICFFVNNFFKETDPSLHNTQNGGILAKGVLEMLEKEGYEAVLIDGRPPGQGGFFAGATNSPFSNAKAFSCASFEEAAELVASCDIVLNTSSYEPSLEIFLKIMSLGVPIVATNSHAISHFYNGKNLFLVEGRNWEDVAAAVRALLSDKEKYSSIAKEALITAQSACSRGAAKSIEEKYVSLAKTKKGPLCLPQNLMNISPGSGKFSLIVSLYNEDDAERRAEYLFCLKKNLSNPAIENICVFFDVTQGAGGEIHRLLSEKKLTVVYCISKPRFSELFDFVNRNLSGRKIIIANADIYFDETLPKLLAASLENKFVALTRWNEAADGNLVFSSDSFSADAFVFIAPISIPRAHYRLGTIACDPLIAAQARLAGYEVLDPCLSIRANHRHRSAKRKYISIDMYSDPWEKLSFTALPGDKSL